MPPLQSLKTLQTMTETGELDLALSGYRDLLAKEPKNIAAWVDYGIALRKARQGEQAINAYEQALRLRPDLSPAIYTNIGNILLDQKHYDRAIEHYQKTLNEQPHNMTAQLNWGHALYGMKQWKSAIAQYQRVLSLNPAQGDAYFHISLCYLMLGDYLEGFKAYEWRFRRDSTVHQQHRITQPQWLGEPLMGKTLFIHCEQGFGDILQFSRFTQLLSAYSGNILMECPAPLFTLFQSLTGVHQRYRRNDALPNFDLHIPLLSLPYVLKTTYETIPQHIPYLTPSKITQHQWKERFKNALAHHPHAHHKVGFVWAGSTENLHTFRSTTLNDFARLFLLPDITWINLQIDDRKHGLTIYPDIIDLTEHICDFSDTAALMLQCDLIITVDSAAAHLAGSLGIPCWVLLADPPDWRWGPEGTTSPWYPHTQLFRQSEAGNWVSVFKKLEAALIARNNT